MNTAKREEKIARYENLAKKFKKEGEEKTAQGFERLKAIPFGQPILVGHYSEKGDRSFRTKSNAMISKGYEIQKKADYYADKAERMEENTAISSDDPEAIEKLTAKLATLENVQQRMKEENAKARKEKTTAPFAGFYLTNNSANIRTVKQRIAQLAKRDEMEAMPDIVGDGYTVREDKDENRIMFVFDGIPAQETRDILKGHGFKWSPTRCAWVRQLNTNGRYATKRIIEKLKSK